MCLGCQEMKPKKEMIRVVKNNMSEISVDTSGKKPGRGAYICKSDECLKRAVKGRNFEKAFEMKVGEDIEQMLSKELEEINAK
jgi:predicted RNA-binding protein YlxR (DUF448 family)